ncbi:tRNA pseudouridine synthase B [Novipirellula aureliae]|uniref:tRNA pseudouridine synthase B n=1 Tax=Novipirellula aureliae TaxID=2527966 RepID=A0A5C6EB71_9BACT|nr:tRNA pseudouridine(55) synthase TruB [Novipirellula aureliae]TWU44991.1 tRNA pseudouridine synthase B [Novipirellula aureliae]
MFGFINCNKPAGMTSRDVVNIVANRIRPHKAGHAGTLDPLAEGVLVIGVGRASRLVEYVQECEKQYRATFRFGVSSASGDLEQPLVEHPSDPQPCISALEKSAAALTGEIEQVPSAFSAIWVDGKRAYERVRRGEKVEIPKRRVMIHSLRILRYEYPLIELDIVCGSGTYVRSLGIDLAKSVSANAVMTHLRRTRIGPFRIEDAVAAERLKVPPLDRFVEPATKGVEHLPVMRLDREQAWRIGNGLSVQMETTPPLDPASGKIAAAIAADGSLRAIVRGKTKAGNTAWYPEKGFSVNQPR